MKIFNKSLFDRKPDAILFDTDNTLYPYAPAHRAAHSAVRAKVVSVLSITEDEFEEAL